MIREKNKGILIVLSGPSGVGKGSVCEKVLEDMNEIKLSISMTSREPRSHEVEGKDYYFISKEEFKKKIEDDEFLEYAIVHSNHYYGTPKSKIEEYLNSGISVLLEIDIQGALKVKKIVKDALFIFIMPPNMEVLKSRLVNRGTETKDRILERLTTAYKEVNEFKKYNYVVVNDELDVAVDKVKSIIKAEKCRVDRIEEINFKFKEDAISE